MVAYSQDVKNGEPTTFELQNSLPKLPVPPLDQTLKTYLNTLRPQLLQEAADQGLAEGKPQQEYLAKELKKREAWAKDFASGLGVNLQERLFDIDRAVPNNWLNDRWWLEMAYHTWRVPLIINSNWWVLFKDDEGIPESVRTSVPPKGEFTPWQIKRAALLTHRTAAFHVRLNKGLIPSDKTRSGALCMQQLQLTFSQTRTPGIPRDHLTSVPFPNTYRTALVYANDYPYTIEVVDAQGEAASIKLLESQLWAIAQDAKKRGPNPVPVSVLTADDRDSWTWARERLLALNPKKNRETLTSIENALFGISLDSWTVKVPYENSAIQSKSPDNLSHILAAKAAGGEGRNRWWDKAITFSVESNGRASLLGEHSPCDALIPSLIAENVASVGLSDQNVIAQGYDATSDALTKSISKVSSLETLGIDKLDFVTDASTSKDIEHAFKTIKEIVDDSDAQQYWYDEYGTDFVKKTAKQAPDAYCQMALQIAYFLTHGHGVSTYETASTRAFRHGRTDVIRSFSEPALLLSRAVKRFLDKGEKLSADDAKTIHTLLTTATKAQTAYTRDASIGKGIDRHFLGLRLLLREGESHPLFTDPLFAKSQNWILSTSSLTAAPYFNGTGFGSPQDGYGINYLAGPNVIKFGIDSKRSSKKSDIKAFKENLTKAFRLLRDVSLVNQGAQSAKL